MQTIDASLPMVELLDFMAKSDDLPSHFQAILSSASRDVRRLSAEKEELLAHLELLPRLEGTGIYATRTREILWRFRKPFSVDDDRFALELMLDELEYER